MGFGTIGPLRNICSSKSATSQTILPLVIYGQLSSMKATLRIFDSTKMLKALEMAEPASNSGTLRNLIHVPAIVRTNDYSPPPAKAFWACGRYSIQLAGRHKISVRVYAESPRRSILPVHSKSEYPETMVRCLYPNASTPTNISQTMYAESVDFGIMFDQTTMMNMRTVLPTRETGIRLRMNMFYKEISVEFPMHIVDPRATSDHSNMQRGKYDRTELFQFRIPFTQLKVIHRIAGQEHKLILLISMETPPKFFKQLDPSKSHDDKAVTWGDNDSWYRQTDLVYVPNGLKKASLTWKKTNPIIDLGKHYSFPQDAVTDLSKDAGLPIV